MKKSKGILFSIVIMAFFTSCIQIISYPSTTTTTTTTLSLPTTTTTLHTDITPPTVVSLSPTNGTSAVDPITTTRLVITFSEPMKTTGYAFCTSSEGIYPPTTGSPVWTSDTTIEVPVSLSSSTTYALSLNNATYTSFKDANGNALVPVVWSFSTIVDSTAPTIVSLSPANGSSLIDATTTTRLAITFSEPMKTTGYAFCTSSEGIYPPTTGSPVWTSDTTIEVPVSLSSSTTYALSLNNATYTSFKDANGNALVPVVWSFSTSP